MSNSTLKKTQSSLDLFHMSVHNPPNGVTPLGILENRHLCHLIVNAVPDDLFRMRRLLTEAELSAVEFVDGFHAKCVFVHQNGVLACKNS